MSNRPELGVGIDNPPDFGLTNELQQQLITQHASIIHALDLLPDQTGWENKVTNVAVILTGSRSGSSLIFDALANSGEVVAPAGEHEPWLTITNNKWPFTDSDELVKANDRETLLGALRNDLLVRQEQIDGQEAANLLWNRAVVRMTEKHPVVQRLVGQLASVASIDRTAFEAAAATLTAISKKLRPVVQPEQIGMPGYTLPVENPPYIDQPLARRATLDELSSKPLLFKSPSDAYRPGFYESLFPNACISYLHLTRGFAQTANGLMDGWSAHDTDFISNAVGLIDPLRIEGYADTAIKRAYWCFDLPPDWQQYGEAPLLEVCVQQWLQAHQAILKNFNVHQQIAFESFYADPDNLYKLIDKSLGIDLRGYDWHKQVMSTEAPRQFRWMKRVDLFRNLGKHVTGQTVADVTDMQRALGYSMEESTWH